MEVEGGLWSQLLHFLYFLSLDEKLCHLPFDASYGWLPARMPAARRPHHEAAAGRLLSSGCWQQSDRSFSTKDLFFFLRLHKYEIIFSTFIRWRMACCDEVSCRLEGQRVGGETGIMEWQKERQADRHLLERLIGGRRSTLAGQESENESFFLHCRVVF